MDRMWPSWYSTVHKAKVATGKTLNNDIGIFDSVDLNWFFILGVDVRTVFLGWYFSTRKSTKCKVPKTFFQSEESSMKEEISI